MVRFLRVDPIVSGSSTPELDFHLERGESPALFISRNIIHP